MGKSAMVIINPSSGKEKAAEYEDRIKETAGSNIGSDIDGEQGPKLPLEIKVMPGHLKVLSGG